MGEEDERFDFVRAERQKGNALFTAGFVTEAQDAYTTALDACRLFPLYKAVYGAVLPKEPAGARTIEGKPQVFPAEEISQGRILFAAIHLNLANCDLKRERYKAAAEHCRLVAAEDPTNVKAMFRWGKAKNGLGEYESAIEKLEKA